MTAPRRVTSSDDDLLGAFALDAVDDEERAAVETRLDRDVAARHEVDTLREAAALLALLAVDEEPPPSLWSGIHDEISSDRDRADVVTMRRSRRRVVELRRVVPLGAAAALALVLLATWGLAQRGELADLRGETTVARAADTAFARPDATTAVLEVDATSSLRIVQLPDGTGFLVDDAGALAPLPGDRTYQLWALVGDPDEPTVISAGVLGAAPEVVPFTVSGPVVGFALTVEAAGGVVSSDQPPIGLVTLT